MNLYLLFAGSAPEVHQPRNLTLTLFALAAATTLFLTWLIARRTSFVAKWLYVALAAVRIGATIAMIFVTGNWRTTFTLLALTQLFLLALTVTLLFVGESRDWFAQRAPVDPDVFS